MTEVKYSSVQFLTKTMGYESIQNAPIICQHKKY